MHAQHALFHPVLTSKWRRASFGDWKGSDDPIGLRRRWCRLVDNRNFTLESPTRPIHSFGQCLVLRRCVGQLAFALHAWPRFSLMFLPSIYWDNFVVASASAGLLCLLQDIMSEVAKKVPAVQVFGRKKNAVAVAYTKAGKGLLKVNGSPIQLLEPETLRIKALEPVLLLGKERFANLDIRVRVQGGGYVSQAFGA